MATTNEYVGHVAHMAGNLMDFIGGAGYSDFEKYGLTTKGAVQITDGNGVLHTFAEIVGNVDPAWFTEIVTKAQANDLILSSFVPHIYITCSEYFFRDYLRRFAQTDTVYSMLRDDATDAEILLALKDAGCKFIKMTTYEGPLFSE